MTKKWLVWDLDMDELTIQAHGVKKYDYQYTRSLAIQLKKRDGGNYEVREDTDE